ncbi:hypothetical protein H8D85_00505 [bacterium]|nr:hypothetical protein [bacterium]
MASVLILSSKIRSNIMTIKYRHYRTNLKSIDPTVTRNCTAITTCTINVDGVEAIGTSHCSPKDEFNKKIGRTIAYGRAMKIANTI